LSEKYWYQGQPFQGLDADEIPSGPNQETYWVDGQPSGDIFLLADSWPFVPPEPPPAPDPSPWGSEFYWFEGQPFQGLSNPEDENTGAETFWINGAAATDIFTVIDQWPYFPPSNQPVAFDNRYGAEKFWLDGRPHSGLKGTTLLQPGHSFFWFEEDFFERQNGESGRMFSLFN
jgi:hypothetical protein